MSEREVRGPVPDGLTFALDDGSATSSHVGSFIISRLSRRGHNVLSEKLALTKTLFGATAAYLCADGPQPFARFCFVEKDSFYF